MAYPQDKGWGRPGSIKWHENNINICSTPIQLIEYLYEIIGTRKTHNRLREKALEIILEAKEKGDI